jgi:hypothetical protein
VGITLTLEDMPVFIPYSERSSYYTWFGYGNIRGEESLEERLLLDIESMLFCMRSVDIY